MTAAMTGERFNRANRRRLRKRPAWRHASGVLCSLSLVLSPSPAPSVSALSLPPSATARSSASITTSIPSQPCVGHATTTVHDQHGRTTRVNHIIIGTSHLRCRSAQEVRALLHDVRPDGVVVELDPERLVRLTKEGCKPSSDGEERQLFGEDFLAAIDTAREMDVPLFLGDEYPRETRGRLVRTALEPGSYAPGRLTTAFFPQRARPESSPPLPPPPHPTSRVDLVGTFAADPMKLAPLGATALPPLLLFLATLQGYQINDVGTNASTALSLLISFLVTTKVWNTLIADRDDVLAANMVRAARVVSSLKRGDAIRKRWAFTVHGERETADAPADHEEQKTYDGGLFPLFTLATPLLTGKVRNLNLFEPRWLKMIDGVKSRPLGLQSFGCVTCVNKFYSAIDVDGVEGRYADVIFERTGTMAALTGLVEGKRPVSGDRRVSARIEGGDTFRIEDEGTISVSKDGYLVASDVAHSGSSSDEQSISAGSMAPGLEDEEQDAAKEVTIVAVVGLLHANGVVDRLSTS